MRHLALLHISYLRSPVSAIQILRSIFSLSTFFSPLSFFLDVFLDFFFDFFSTTDLIRMRQWFISAGGAFSSPEPRILWLRMTRGSGKLCRSLAKIWLFGPHGACSQSKQEIRKWPRYLVRRWISLFLKLEKTAISN